MEIDKSIKPFAFGRIREEQWGGIHYYRNLPCINLINETAFFILSRCDGKNTIESIESELLDAFDAPAEAVRADFYHYIVSSAQNGYIKADGLPNKGLLPSTGNQVIDHDQAMLDGLGVIGVGDNVLSAPIKVLIETTHNCNLRCVHCFAGAKCEVNAPNGYLPGELTGEEWCRVIDNLDKAGVFDVFVSGGEAMMRKDIFEICEHIQSRGMGFCLLTNMTLLDDAAAKRMKEIGCYKVEGNLDGPDAKSYDLFRGMPGAFEQTIIGIRACQNNDLPFRLNVTATKMNIGQLKDIVTTAVELGAKELCVVPLEKGGRARDNWNELALSPDEHVELMKYYTEVTAWVQETYGDQIFYIGPCDHLLEDAGSKIIDMIDPNRILPQCGAGKFHCSIAPSGRVILCPTAGEDIPINPGDCLNEDFHEIWHNADVFKAIRNSDISACSECDYKNCGGGCQVNAWVETGKIGVYPDSECIKVYETKMARADRLDSSDGDSPS